MIDMSMWRERTIDVLDDVLLDPRNVRLGLDGRAPQADIILDLFKNEKALALVEGIVKVGYLTHEVPIVIERDDELFVVEGNRRMAALKAIQNPYLVPDFQSRITALADGFTGREQLRRVTVKVAPSQDEADQLVATLHAGNPRVAWTPARQAAFFQAQVDAGKTLSELRSNYPMIGVEKYVLRSAILNRFRSVVYSTDELNDYVRSRNFSTSTLARIYESRDFISLTGLRLEGDGQIAFSIPGEAFDGMAEIIVQGMHSGDISTRSVGTVKTPRFQALIDELKAVLARSSGAPPPTTSPPPGGGQHPGGSGGGGPMGTSPGGPGGAGGRSGTTTGGPPAGPGGMAPGKRTSKSFLDVSDLSPPQRFPAPIPKILKELSTLNVDRYPNASFDLLRTLLEKTIKAFAEVNGEDIKRSGKNQNGFVYLSNCLQWLEEWFTNHGPRAQVQVAKKVQSAKLGGFAGSKEHMDAINHNHHVFATGDDVRVVWDTMKSLLAEMLK
jgi:hypothetical protein